MKEDRQKIEDSGGVSIDTENGFSKIGVAISPGVDEVPLSDERERQLRARAIELSGCQSLIEERRSNIHKAVRMPFVPIKIILKDRRGSNGGSHSDIIHEFTFDELERCMNALKADFNNRGIVVISPEKTINNYLSFLKKDKTAGITWKVIEEKLKAHDGLLLKKVAAMQDGGELIGIDSAGKLYFKDRGNVPVTYGYQCNNGNIEVNDGTDSLFVPFSCVEICNHVKNAGYVLPQYFPDCMEKGIIPAIVAVTGLSYVESTDGKSRSTVLACEEDLMRIHTMLSKTDYLDRLVHVVNSFPDLCNTLGTVPSITRNLRYGAVRLCIG
ncbi:hypothetical protein HYV57_01735 [Candidatus Peregrinibacteria bacterium]|nr:hypothetical protein [Candidatus Peregrinibacteria bacterium]